MMHLVQDAQIGGLHLQGGSSYINGGDGNHIIPDGDVRLSPVPRTTSTRSIRIQPRTQDGDEIPVADVPEVALLLSWILFLTRQQSDEQQEKHSRYVWGYHVTTGADELLPLPQQGPLAEALNAENTPRLTIADALISLNISLGRDSHDSTSKLGSGSVLFFSAAISVSETSRKSFQEDEVRDILNRLIIVQN